MTARLFAPTDSSLPLEQVRACTALLEAIVADRGLLASLPEEDRRALLMAAGRVSRPERNEQIKLNKAIRRERRRQMLERDRALRDGAGIREARLAPVFVAPKALPATARPSPTRELGKPRNCYVCKAEYRQLHFFYDAMCPPCGDENYEKRFQTADLRGRVAVLTGARVKIGFQASLMLLRSGARVVATTRFPQDAAQRYAREPDFSEWRDRLQIHGLDLRHAPSVELFTRHLDRTLERLDFLVNNAAQTVRRPPGFYRHLLPTETAPLESLPPEARPLLESHRALVETLGSGAARLASGTVAGALATWGRAGAEVGVGLTASPQLSLIPYDYEDGALAPELFPAGHTDADEQQVDLRAHNSWRMTLAEVPTPEMLEVHLVNAVAPFILCSRLKPLMLRTPGRDKHMVNVSAMEGSFSRKTKTDKHPHTNMAKAALNMLTLTSAPDYLRAGIHLNAVDTGRVTDEDPAVHAARKREELGFQPPLDIVDGAARVVDPILSGINTGEHVSGKFLKDYKPTEW